MALERYSTNERAIHTAPEHFIPATLKMAEALKLAKKAHEGQFRKTGEPFYYHPVAVAQILQSWGLDQESHEDLIISALLHDVPEDNENIGLDVLQASFGNNVAILVDGVTKVEKQIDKDVDRETVRKVSQIGFVDPRVFLVKLADRLHNMRTLNGMSNEKQIEKSRETLDVYAKTAESLGLWPVKKELEDLSFMYLEPENFLKIKTELEDDERHKPNFLAYTVSSIENILAEHGVQADVYPRINGYRGLFYKREEALTRGKTMAHRAFHDINDVVSFRVITQSVDDCYHALGLIHGKFSSEVDMERFDEFIAKPRTNGYTVLQTNLDKPQGAIEIAIATHEMEEFNKMGVVTLLR